MSLDTILLKYQEYNYTSEQTFLTPCRLSNQRPTIPYQGYLHLSVINFSVFTIVSIYSRIAMNGYMLASYTQTGTIICHQFQCIYHLLY